MPPLVVHPGSSAVIHQAHGAVLAALLAPQLRAPDSQDFWFCDRGGFDALRAPETISVLHDSGSVSHLAARRFYALVLPGLGSDGRMQPSRASLRSPASRTMRSSYAKRCWRGARGRCSASPTAKAPSASTARSVGCSPSRRRGLRAKIGTDRAATCSRPATWRAAASWCDRCARSSRRRAWRRTSMRRVSTRAWSTATRRRPTCSSPFHRRSRIRCSVSRGLFAARRTSGCRSGRRHQSDSSLNGSASTRQCGASGRHRPASRYPTTSTCTTSPPPTATPPSSPSRTFDPSRDLSKCSAGTCSKATLSWARTRRRARARAGAPLLRSLRGGKRAAPVRRRGGRADARRSGRPTQAWSGAWRRRRCRSSTGRFVSSRRVQTARVVYL